MVAMYESEITRFLRELKAARPQIEQEQRRGRAIWWDKPQELQKARDDNQSHVAQKPYVYQTDE